MTVTAIPDGSLTYTGYSAIAGGISTFVPSGSITFIGQIVVFGASASVTKIHLPPPNVPFVTQAGLVRPEWYKFLENLFRRVGGAEQDLVAQSAVIAQNAANTVGSVSNATTALAESIASVQSEVSSNTEYIENYGPRIKSLEDY